MSAAPVLFLSLLLCSFHLSLSTPATDNDSDSIKDLPPAENNTNDISFDSPLSNQTEFVIELVLETFCGNRSDEDAKLVEEERNAARQIISGLLNQSHIAYEQEEKLPPSNVTESVYVPGACTSEKTINLTEYWRKDSNGSKLALENGKPACDTDLQADTVWFRFSGNAGRQLLNKCPPSYSCGTHGGFWSDAEMPFKVGEIRQVPIYGSWQGNCKWYSWPTPNSLTVQRCSKEPGDFVYKVHGTVSCFWGFCGMDAE